MTHRLARQLIVGVLVLGLALMAAPSAYAGAISVDMNSAGCVSGSGQPDPYGVVYCQIHDAVSDAASGDTITVAPGAYNENVTINKNLTLVSSGGRAVTTITGISGVGSLGTVVVTNNTTGVQIGAPGQGFTIVGLDNGLPGIENAAVYFQGSHSNARILDNEIAANGDHGLLTEYGATISGFVIDGNEFSGQTFTGPNPAGYGFSQQFTLPNVPRQLVVMGGGSGGGSTSNITFTNNQITGTAGGLNTSGQEQGNTLVTIDSNGATITGNTFAGTTTRYGTSLRARGPATTISGNTFNSAGLSPTTGHLYVQNTGSNVSAIAAANTFDKGVYVDGPAGTIGVNIGVFVAAVPPGTTVEVMAGVYTEQIVINKNLTLHGSGNPVITAPGSPAAFKLPESSAWWEPVLVAFGGLVDGSGNVSGAGQITVDISGLVVDGNDRAPTGGRRSAGLLLRNAVGTVSGNTVRNMHVNGAQTFGIMVYGNSTLTIRDNAVSGYARGGIGANGDLGVLPDPQVVVENNTVTGPGLGVPVTWAPNGIQIGWGGGGEIRGNRVSGNGWPGTEWSGSGIIIAGASDVQIAQNSVTGNETGIAVVGDNWFGSGSIASGTVIRGNTVENNTYGISLQDRVAGTLVEENVVTGNEYDGIDVVSFSAYQAPPTGTKIFNNHLAGNNTAGDPTSGGLWVSSTVSTVDASGNWWGSNTPAGVPAQIFGPADYTPWLDTGVDTAAAAGFQGDFATLWVDDDSPQTGPVGRIQEGVNLVSGSTVNVAAGTYVENVDITKRLTLQGAGSGADPAGNTIVTAATTGHPTIKIQAEGTSAAERLVVRHMRVTGSNVSGIEFGAGSGSFTTLQNVAATGNGGDGISTAIAAGTPHLDLQLVDCLMFENGDSGFVLGAADAFDGLSITNSHANNNQTGHGVYLKGPVTGLAISGGTFNYNGNSQNDSGIWISALNKDFTAPGSNLIRGVEASHNGRGILVYVYGGPGLAIEEVTAENNSHTLYEMGGITVYNKDEPLAGLQITGSTANGNAGTGIYVRAYSAAIGNVTLDNVEADQNDAQGVYLRGASGSAAIQAGAVTNSRMSGNATGLRLRGQVAGVNITGNNILQNQSTTTGLVLEDGAAAGGNHANFNNIVGNSTGVSNTGPDAFDAACNWWGAASGPGPVGPGSGDTVSAGVHFAPWLLGEAPDGQCGGIIYVQKYEDVNGNGLKDESEPGLSGWLVTLFDSANQELASSTTGDDGQVWFDRLIPGLYTVCETGQPGWFNSDPGGDAPFCKPVTVGADEETGQVTVWFGNYRPGRIRVHKYDDLNGNGRKNYGPPEPGVEAWQFELYNSSGSQVGAVQDTGPNGWTTFAGLKPGLYTVCELEQAGWLNTEPGDDRAADPSGAGRPCRQVAVTSGGSPQVKFGNYRQGLLTVEKSATPHAWWKQFKFTGTIPGWPYFDLSGATPAGTNDSRTFNLPMGDYSVREVADQSYANWSLTGLSCECGAGVSGCSWYVDQTDPRQVWVNIDESGETITCTFENKRNPQLEILKYEDVNGNGARDEGEPALDGWNIAIYYDYGNGWEQVQRTKTTGEQTPGSGSVAFTNLPPGNFLACEELQPGWLNSQPGAAPNNGGQVCQPVNDVQPGEVRRVAFGNYRPGKITIVKQANPSRSQNPKAFNFETSLPEGAFTLYGSGDPALNRRSFDGLDLNTAYTFTELDPGNWVLAEISCDGGSWQVNAASVSVTLTRSGAEVTCTFRNERRGQLKITKYEDLNASGSRDSNEPGLEGWQMFLYMGPDPQTMSQIQPREVRTNADGIAHYTNLEIGQTYWVCEEAREGWAIAEPAAGVVLHQDGNGPKLCQKIDDLQFGQVRPVVFGNYRPGEITIIKEAIPARSQDPKAFNFETSLPEGAFTLYGSGDPALNRQTFGGLALNVDHTFTELDPGNWDLTGLTCDGGNWQANGATVSVRLAASGEKVTCTFQNKKQAQLKIFKYHDLNRNGQQDEGEPYLPGWEISIYFDTGNGWQQVQRTKATGSNGRVDFTALESGNYLVCETPQAGWVNTAPGNTAIEHNGQICRQVNGLDYGDNETVEFGNAQATGSITVVKEVVGPVPQTGWSFSGSLGSFDLPAEGGETTFDNLEAGSYTISEAAVEGYTSRVSCDNAASGSNSVTFDLQPGQNVVCTFTNTYQTGSLTIVKAVSGQKTGWLFNFTGDLGQFSLAHEQSKEFTGLQAGTAYTVQEDKNSFPDKYWALFKVSCQGNSAPVETDLLNARAAITVQAGEQIVCTFFNERVNEEEE